jgi:tRNA (guanine37-N1)-methyltransferase
LRVFLIFKVLTLCPEFFESPLKTGLLGKAIGSGVISVEIIDLRSFSEDKFRRCDDYPYGGGAGMVLMPGPLFSALASTATEECRVVLPAPGGRVLTQHMVRDLTREKCIYIVCGHYEGVDQRVIDRFVDYEISVGDYVLSGGEFAAIVIIDAVSRYVPGFMSNNESLLEESFENDLLEYPQFTRPAEFDGLMVPEILLSGNHKNILEWRLDKKIEKTRGIRPDLYKNYLLKKIVGE